MDKKMFKIGYLVGVLLIVGIGVYGYLTVKTISNDISINPIELAQLDLENSVSEKVILKSGKPIIINFWATWCVPCVQELPEFEALNKKYGNKVDILLVSDEENSKINNFKQKKGYKLNMLRSTKPFKEYGLIGRPATYFYNSKGVLISKISGSITKEELEEGISNIIE
jgi:cytochrome c biogenesis protein CcmG/thiol:disulfide interchange protein DsbE